MSTRTWLVAGISLAFAGPAAGQGRRPAPHHRTARAHGADLAPAIAALGGADVEAAAKAAATLGASPDPAAHEALLDALALGLPPAVAVPALGALVAHPTPPDVVALRRYAAHRDPDVRAAALAALAHDADPAARAAVVAGLHDEIASVRAAAAGAAAAAHLHDAVEPLLQLLARGEEPAAAALARLADADLARRIADQLGRVPDAVLAHCLGAVLVRPDFGPDPARVEVVRAIAKISDPAAISVLTDYLDATPKNPPRPSRAEAEQVVERKLGAGR